MLNTPNNETNVSTTTAAADITSARNSGANNNQPKSFRWGNLGGMMRSAMSRNPASEVLVKAQKAIEAQYAKRPESVFKVALLPIDMQTNTQLGISALVVVVQDINIPNKFAYHTFILEGSTEPAAPKYENINGRQVEIIRLACDANDEILHSVIRNKLAASYQGGTFDNADSCVVPRDFKFDDEVAVYSLAANGLMACTTELEIKRRDFIDLNLAQVDRDSTLTVRPTFTADQSAGLDGLPIRTDVVIDFNSTVQNNQQQQTADRTNTIATIGGFVDLAWDPISGPVNAWVAANQNQQQINQSYVKYVSRFVITALESHDILTVGTQLLALLPAMSLRENNQWANAFRPAPFNNGIDLRDIGAIGIEVNFENNPTGVGSRIDTKSASFTDQSLFQLLAATVRPGMVVMLDVPECGPSTWYNNIFVAESKGDTRARAAIIAAANQLTNNNFSKHYKNPEAFICDNENNIIHMGYYEVNGVRRDIREIDALAVLNKVGEQDPQLVVNFTNTYLDRQAPIALRLSERKKILTSLVSNLTITGKAMRLAFSAEFLDALAKGAADCGLVIRPFNQYQDQSMFERSSAGYSNNNLMSSDSVGIFNRNINMGGNTRFTGQVNRVW